MAKQDFMNQSGNVEAWVWTELLAFDNTQSDCGVSAYLAELGFVPQGACLFLGTPDFILNHRGMTEDEILPPDVCSRNGQPCNERRNRQEWSRGQLKKLIGLLNQAGCKVYCSGFTTFLENRFHEEWLSHHREALLTWCSCWRGQEVNPLAELDDGSLFEDIFIERLCAVCRDYGFAGWHGPDGWGPWSAGNITDIDFTDATLKQFFRFYSPAEKLPECFNPVPRIVTQQDVLTAQREGKEPPQWGLSQLKARREWIISHCYTQWRKFLVQRWKQFWGKALEALHEIGCQGVVNSAWTKGSFDALYEYAIDYRIWTELGMDAMVVETVALGMSQGHPDVTWYHDSYAAALAEIRAFNPDLKLIMLHGIKDVEECWDNLRHAPTAYERELYKLGNMFYRGSDGSLKRAAEGLLCCLADGISAGEWELIRSYWKKVFEELPQNAGNVTAIVFEEQIDSGISDYDRDGFMPALDQVSTLMETGVSLQCFAHIRDLDNLHGALLVPGAHLLRPEMRRKLMQYAEPVIWIGRAEALTEIPGIRISDSSMTVILSGCGTEESLQLEPVSATQKKPDASALYFSERRYRKPVNPELWKLAAAKIAEHLAHIRIVSSKLPVTLLVKEFADGTEKVMIENRAVWGKTTVTLQTDRPIASVEVETFFPPRVSSLEKNGFTVVVPPQGVTAVKIQYFSSAEIKNRGETLV